MRGNQRLIEKVELVGIDGLAHIMLEPNPFFGSDLHLRIEVAEGGAAHRFRVIESQVGFANEIVDSIAINRAIGTANTQTDPDLHIVNHIGFADRGDHFFGQGFNGNPALGIVHHNRKLVSADTAYSTTITHNIGEPPRDCFQDSVALGMAERIIDRFESIKIQEKNGARDTAILGVA